MDMISHGTGERWEFRCDRAAGGWQWRRHARDGSIAAASRRAFVSLEEAVSDAIAAGFTYTIAQRET